MVLSKETSAGEKGNIAILGSTGSVGKQALEVVRASDGRYRVTSLTAHRNVELLCAQALEFRPQFVALGDEEAASEVRSRLPSSIVVGAGAEAISKAATLPEVHTVLAAVIGFAGLASVLAAISEGKHIALANKESLVTAAKLVRNALSQSTSMLVPVDSEHSSLFQCLLARESPRRVIITASGGPFFQTPLEELAKVTPAQAVRHPRWSMGTKISVDSATLMNKGLEVIEAAELFQLSADKIEVLVHPQSVIHGLVEYDDGSTLACLFENDMRVPIAFALGYLYSECPKTHPGVTIPRSGAAYLDLVKRGALEFFEPDTEKFPALLLCYQALRVGGGAGVVLNAANEILVEAFMSEQVGYLDIARLVAKVLSQHEAVELETIEDISRLDAWARNEASNRVEQLNGRLK